MKKRARNYFKEKVYKTVIPRNVRLSEAPSHGIPVLIYDKSCPGSKSYFNLTEEFPIKKNFGDCSLSLFKQKKGLGRGLSSLIGDNKKSTIKNKISISEIVRGKFQPRKIFDKASLEELTSSIKERGVVQPIIVRKSKEINGKYEIIAGERRWLASQNAGLNEIPVVVIEADDIKALEFGIVENVQRSDLNPVEEATGYKRLMDEFGYDRKKLEDL